MSNVSSIKSTIEKDYSSIFDFLYKNTVEKASNININSNGVEIVDIDGNIQEPRSIAEFFSILSNDTAANIVSGLKTIGCEYEWYQDFVSFLDESVLPTYEASCQSFFDTVDRVGATVTVGVQSLGEGILNVGEGIVDVLILAGSAIGTIGTGLADLWQIVNGNEAKYTSELWDSTMSTVSIDAVGDAFDSLYEDTEYGRNLMENAYFFDQVRGIGTGIGQVVGIVGLSLITFGFGSLASSGTVSVSLGQTSTIASIIGFGQGTEDAWADGASLLEGLFAGGANSLWEGIQYYIGGKIGTTTFFGNNGIISCITKNGFGTKVLDSLTRIFLDGFDGGAEGIVQPLIASIYKDGYYDESGNYIEFTKSDNFFKRYGEIFSDYGGVQNIFTNALIGSGSSLLGEVFDIGKFFRNTSNTDVSSLTNKVDPNELKVFNNELEIAEYFNDPKGFVYQKLRPLMNVLKRLSLSNYANVNNPQIVNTIMADIQKNTNGKISNFNDALKLADISVNRSVNDINLQEFYKAFSSFLTSDDKKLYKKILEISQNNELYSDIEKKLIQSYTHSSGPLLTAYLRKTKTDFLGATIYGDNKGLLSSDLANNLYALYAGSQLENLSSQLSKYADIDNFVNAMDTIIDKSPPLKQRMIVYRAVNDLFLDGNKLLTFNVGQRFNDQAFISISLIPKVFQNRKILLELEVPAGTKAAYLEQYTGVRNYGQQELLLGRNNIFEIIDNPIINSQNRIILKARLIPEQLSMISQLGLDTLTKSGDFLKYYQTFIKKGTSLDQMQVDVYDIIKYLKDTELLGRYKSEIRYLKNSDLYKLNIPEHNIDHIERVLLYVMYMGKKMNFDNDSLNLLIEAAKFHDSGRVYLETDVNHGLLSADMARNYLIDKYSYKELQIISAIIELHEASDANEAVWDIFKKYEINRYNPSEQNIVYALATILKDADAIDRVRFPGNLDVGYLHNTIAPSIIKASYQIQELRATYELDKILNNKNTNDKIVTYIESLRKNKVSDYLIYFYLNYGTKYVGYLINKIIGGNNG